MAGLAYAHCAHIYQDLGVEICPHCNRPTHETDWAEQAKLHRQWIADGKADWSICPQGGPLRGWWSI